MSSSHRGIPLPLLFRTIKIIMTVIEILVINIYVATIVDDHCVIVMATNRLGVAMTTMERCHGNRMAIELTLSGGIGYNRRHCHWVGPGRRGRIGALVDLMAS